ncbi:hypothetical protein SprV_0200778900 [Sparganum proliferum]
MLSMDLFASNCANFGLTINTDKTVVMHQPPPNSVLRIYVNGTELQTVNNFNCLDSTILRCIGIDDEVPHRISKDSQVFDRLQNSMWNRHGLRLSIKLGMYKAVVLANLLYEAGIWTVYSSHARKINRFHLNCLPRILKLRWQDRILDTEILE